MSARNTGVGFFSLTAKAPDWWVDFSSQRIRRRERWFQSGVNALKVQLRTEFRSAKYLERQLQYHCPQAAIQCFCGRKGN